jgi:hypothetical protein
VQIPECPVCHKRASLEGQQLYCANCGWNRDMAIAAIRASMKMLPVGLVMFAGFILFLVYGWHFRNPAQIVIFCGVPAFGLLVNYLYAKSRLAKLEALPAASSPPAVSAAGSSDSLGEDGQKAEAIPPDGEYQALRLSSRPRQIRMAKRGQFNIAIGLIVVLIFAMILGVHLYGVWARTLSFAAFGPPDWLVVGLAALILLIPYGMWRAQVRECDLLEKGEIALGRVRSQRYGKSNSSITYEFTDFRGQTHQGSGFDYTKKLYEGMTVPVFYDQDNPKRQVAYCSTLHEIVIGDSASRVASA